MKLRSSLSRTVSLVLALAAHGSLLVSCGGGDGEGPGYFPSPTAGTRYSISGTVTDGTNGMAGVTISITGSGTGAISTGADGSFHIGNLQAGTYVLTPSQNSSQYSPSSRTIVLSGADVSGADFTLTMDSSEGAGGDNTSATASVLAVDAVQVRTLYPDGDVDWVKVTFPATADPTDYEFSANTLSNASDVVMNLYDCADPQNPVLLTDAAFLLANPDVDDYIGLDSRIRYTIPAAGGDYCLEVKSNDWVGGITGNGIAAYTLGVHAFVDSDGDSYSDYYDCEPNDDTVHPFATDTPGDGIDQDCTAGYDELAGTTPDAAEPDDTAANAGTMAASGGDGWEYQTRADIFSANARTIDSNIDTDIFTLTIPSKSAVNVHLAIANVTGPGLINAAQVDSNGDPVVPANAEVLNAADPTTYLFIENTSGVPLQVYVRFDASGETGYYVPFYYGVGVDLDGDGYYTQDVPGYRDCNDSDITVFPGQGC